MSEARQERSAAGAIGAGLGSLVRQALNPKQRSRTLRAASAGLQATAGSVRRATRVLWLEVTGFFFLVLSVFGFSALVREFHRYRSGEPVFWKLLLAGVFALVFAYYGVSSFWKARRQ